MPATRSARPEFAVECKSGDASELSRNIAYFSRRTPISRFYQVHLDSERGNAEYLDGRAQIISFLRFCEHLEL